MKHCKLLLPVALAGGALCFALRLVQNRTGFEPDTGLPIAGNAAAIALPVVLAVVAVAVLLLAWPLPAEKEEVSLPFTCYFFTTGSLLPALLVSVVFLWGISGALEIFSALGQSSGGSSEIITSSGIFLFPHLSPLLGLMSVLSALSLFPLASACRHRPGQGYAPISGNLLLAPAACLVVRLVLVYRVESVSPVLGAYYVEILALSFLILSLYRTSSFAFRCGRTRRFAVYTACALTLCITVLADCRSVTDVLLYLGGALLMFTLLSMRIGVIVYRFLS